MQGERERESEIERWREMEMKNEEMKIWLRVAVREDRAKQYWRAIKMEGMSDSIYRAERERESIVTERGGEKDRAPCIL